MKKFLSGLLAANLSLAPIACKDAPPPQPPPEEKKEPPPAEPPVEKEPEPPAKPAEPPPPTRDIIDTADGSDTFKTIVKLIEEAGLTESLRNDGPFTILVPSDEAFAKLAAGELDRIKKDKKSLAALINYHVLTGRAIKSVELATMPTATTAAGPDITIEVPEGGGDLTINGTVKILQADVMTTNGVIHVIDAVLTPVAKKKPKKAK